jgi:hypothetical protein
MPKIERGGPRTLVGQEFYDIEELGAFSFCPDSDDASTPATQVHVKLQVAGLDELGKRKVFPPMVARFAGAETLDAWIEAMIEHRTWVFGRRVWPVAQYPEQPLSL